MRRGDVKGNQNETFVRETLIGYGGGEDFTNGMRICEEVDWKMSSAGGRPSREWRHLTLSHWRGISWDIQSTSHANDSSKPFPNQSRILLQHPRQIGQRT